MKITVEEVERVAILARLRLTDEESSQFTRQLAAILDYMKHLAQLDTERVEPFRHNLNAETSLRDDAILNRPDPESLLANAPDRDGTFFKVPKIVE